MVKNIKVKYWVALTLFFISAVVGFYTYLYVQPWQYNYKGSGIFKDNGVRASSNRYILTLGDYDLTYSALKAQTYIVGKLPQQDMRLALKFMLAEGESREEIDNLKVRISISEVGNGRTYFRYERKLYSHNAGFIPTSYRHSQHEIVHIMYSPEPFTERIPIFGLDSGLYRRGDRKVEFELMKAIAKPLKRNRAELVIVGGGWK